METSSPPPPEAAPRREKLRLKVVEGNAAGTVIEVEDELVIGRLTEGDGTLASDVEISRRHARISADSNGSFGIEDLGSTNGTYVNGRRLEGRAILEAGDRIALGASALVVQVGSLQPTPTASDTVAQAPGSGQPVTSPFALRIEVDPGAGRATVTLDGTSDEITLVHEDGRWRIA